jgi:hypothetical protein
MNRETVLARLSDWEREVQRPSPDNWRILRDVIGFDDRYDEAMTTTSLVPHAMREGPVASRANVHPTVKPIDLMRHLVRLVTPTNGVVLDPFLGSGTTALAASEEGFRCIGIEREAEYLEIAKGRLIATPMGLGLDVAAPTKKRKLMTEEESAERVKSYKGHATFSGGWAWEKGDDEEPAA